MFNWVPGLYKIPRCRIEARRIKNHLDCGKWFAINYKEEDWSYRKIFYHGINTSIDFVEKFLLSGNIDSIYHCSDYHTMFSMSPAIWDEYSYEKSPDITDKIPIYYWQPVKWWIPKK